MPLPSDYPAVGKIIAVNADSIVFQPLGTNYEMKLATDGNFSGKVGQRIECLIRANARKLYTVRSGGSFLVPIFGPTRIVQGRIKYLDERQMAVQAGTSVIVDLPKAESAYDMECGPLSVGNMVNVVCLPGVRVELLAAATAAAAGARTGLLAHGGALC